MHIGKTHNKLVICILSHSWVWQDLKCIKKFKENPISIAWMHRSKPS